MSKSVLRYNIISPSVHMNMEIDLKGNNYTLLSNTESERSRELPTSGSCNCLDLNARNQPLSTQALDTGSEKA